MQRKKLPIGIATFAKIRGENYYYVDKTELALSLIEQGSYYFLSRPRRFGKSLFLDTLAELFAGDETLMTGDFEALRQHFVSLYASIPHDWFRNNPITQYEGYWASVFYSHFAALGLDIRLEDTTHYGRIDMTVLFNGQVYLFEFKVVELVPDGRALAQLKAKNYAEKYRARNQPIHLIGIEFSREARNLVGFAVGKG